MVTINTQSVASIARQVAAIAAIVIGCLQSISLPAWVHPLLIAAGTIVIAIEHYVGDPSTGTTPQTGAGAIRAPQPATPTPPAAP